MRCLNCLWIAGALLAQGGPSLDEILTRHVEARGGAGKMQTIQTLKVSGKTVMMGGQVEASMVMRIKRPNSVRVEMSFQGKNIVQAYDGTTVWTINPFRGGEPQKARDQEAQAIQERADFDGPLVNHKEKGATLELAGKEDVEGTPAYKIKVTRKGGDVDYHYIDTKTFLELKSSSKRAVMGREMEIDAFPRNYKTVNGVLLPFSIQHKVSGKPVAEMTYDSIEANVPIDDAIFRMPVPAQKKESK